jgi:hypothetical protein
MSFADFPVVALLTTSAVKPPVETVATAIHAAVAKHTGHMTISFRGD